MNNPYPEDHPLYGRDAEWIAKQADERADWAVDWAASALPKETVALAHEYRRLRASVSTLSRADALNRKGIANRDVRISELKSTHPPEDWLTRAIERSGAYKGSDWEGLSAHIAALRTQHDTAVARSRRLEERAEAAEAKVKDLTEENRTEYYREYRAWVDNGRPRKSFDLFKQYEELGTIKDIKATKVRITELESEVNIKSKFDFPHFELPPTVKLHGSPEWVAEIAKNAASTIPRIAKPGHTVVLDSTTAMAMVEHTKNLESQLKAESARADKAETRLAAIMQLINEGTP